MNKSLFKSFFLFLSLFIFLSCNNEIFIDGPELPEETNVTVQGDGGEEVFTIPLKGLENISLDIISGSNLYCTYYNHSGEIIESDSPASELSKIVYDKGYIKFQLLKENNRLVFNSIANAGSTTDWTFRLKYDYCVRFINIKVLEGQPLVLVKTEFDSPLNIEEKIETKTSYSFTNPGPIPQILEIQPFLQENAIVYLDAKLPFANQGLNMPVPIMKDGEWSLQEVEGIRPGVPFLTSFPEKMIKVTVQIPAESKVRVYHDIYYSRASVNGKFLFRSSATGWENEVTFNVMSTYPTGYNIRIENE